MHTFIFLNQSCVFYVKHIQGMGEKTSVTCYAIPFDADWSKFLHQTIKHSYFCQINL